MHKIEKSKVSSKKSPEVLYSPELKSAFVKLSHRIESSNSAGQVVRLNGKLFRIKELG